MSGLGFTVAVSGKGGVGKTMLASLMIRYFAKKGSTLAIDADPDSNLPWSLGVNVTTDVGHARESIAQAPARSAVAADKAGAFERALQQVVQEADDFDIVVMGRSEGAGCYCAINHILRDVIDSRASSYDYTIIDTEAGLEHLSRRTTRDVDVMVVVTEPTLNGILTAKRVHELAKELDIGFGHIFVVANKVTPETKPMGEKLARDHGLKIDFFIPFDPAVGLQDAMGKPMYQLAEDSPASKAVKEFCDMLSSRIFAA
ncbi:MAG: AAA family ATPase [Dehalococcoidia bacterium]|nr:AAA family ATPase [Dehalococcoidia bacterium]